VAEPFVAFADDFTRQGRWGRRGFRSRRRGPSIARLLLAGLAVFAFAKVLSAATGRQRSTSEKVLLGGLVLAPGAVLLSFRRSASRYHW
jgi:hypothetical protein